MKVMRCEDMFHYLEEFCEERIAADGIWTEEEAERNINETTVSVPPAIPIFSKTKDIIEIHEDKDEDFKVVKKSPIIVDKSLNCSIEIIEKVKTTTPSPKQELIESPSTPLQYQISKDSTTATPPSVEQLGSFEKASVLLEKSPSPPVKLYESVTPIIARKVQPISSSTMIETPNKNVGEGAAGPTTPNKNIDEGADLAYESDASSQELFADNGYSDSDDDTVSLKSDHGKEEEKENLDKSNGSNSTSDQPNKIQSLLKPKQQDLLSVIPSPSSKEDSPKVDPDENTIRDKVDPEKRQHSPDDNTLNTSRGMVVKRRKVCRPAFNRTFSTELSSTHDHSGLSPNLDQPGRCKHCTDWLLKHKSNSGKQCCLADFVRGRIEVRGTSNWTCFAEGDSSSLNGLEVVCKGCGNRAGRVRFNVTDTGVTSSVEFD